MIRRTARYIVFAVAVVLIAAGLGTFVPRPLWPATRPDEPATRQILLLHNPIHTDIAIPVDAEILERFGFLGHAGLPMDALGLRYLVIGWGGRAFYIETPTWSELKAIPALKALTVDTSVMHVSLYGDISPTEPFVSEFRLSEARYSALLDFIDASFQRDAAGPIQVPDAGYGAFDRFFEANGRFNALVGCNTWTAAALRTAGMRTGWWNPLPVSLDLSLRLYNQR